MLEIMLGGFMLIAMVLIVLEYSLLFIAFRVLKSGAARVVALGLSFAAALGAYHFIGTLTDWFTSHEGRLLYAIPAVGPAIGLVFLLVRFTKKLDAINEQNSQ
ncbi:MULTISPECIES: hypothetical protein [Nitrospirillum]|uniref:Uncharacterized protein n=1 Tax=Nitrospirillum amazonense TaxID=28077 RepID=A0A560G9Z0_9PROT|nr:hypothetical protein [Nitrospirillum amazonense]MEC4591296.1 hypothetical protein [Nitrospirillum amazonense]TWB30715.1 hypothetical protein FBZ88_102280 [Nitrospirillum amazonense]